MRTNNLAGRGEPDAVEGPGAEAPGPRVTGRKHHLPTCTSVCHIRTGRRRRREVRGSHKRDRRPPLVRWKLRCPHQSCNGILVAGDPTVFAPPFPLLPIPVVLSCCPPVSKP